MSKISNYKPADYYWMHSKREYTAAAVKGIIVGGLLGFLLGFFGRTVIGNLFPWSAIGVETLVCVLCAIIGGTWQIILLKREDSRAKQANAETAISVMAQSILSDEE